MTLDEFNRLSIRDFENGAVNDEIAAVFKSRDCLQAIVDKLPKTADGVPLHMGMDVWLIDGAIPRCSMVADATLAGVAYLLFHGAMDGPHDIQELYSTQEAAEQGEKSDAN